MSFLNFLKKSKSKNIARCKEKECIKKPNFDYSSIHPNIENLLWFGQGVRKNYDANEELQRKRGNIGEYFIMLILNKQEPSAIYPKLPSIEPKDIRVVENPNYFPDYIELSSEQRWIYHKYLSNPYDSTFNISYVFLLYYGLERQLIYGNTDEAFSEILKLRDIYNNKSFQYYSANALLFTSILLQRGDLANDFLDSLDNEYEYDIYPELFLLLFYELNVPITARDLIRIHKTFNFNNTNYIKKYPDLFESTLITLIKKELGTDKIYLSNFISDYNMSNSNKTTKQIFSNISLDYSTGENFPLLSKSDKLQSFAFKALSHTHEAIKVILAEMRENKEKLPNNQNIPQMKKLDDAGHGNFFKNKVNK